MAKLTIVTTTYNQEKYIQQALDSFINQKTDFPFEILISDDGSTDKTRDIIDSYKKNYPNIIKTIYRKKNLGPMDNFIQTLSEVDSEYVALCDGDDFWTDPYKLQNQVNFLDKNTDFTICFHQTKIFFEDQSIKEQIYPMNIPIETTIDDLVSLSNYIPANTVVYRWKFTNKNTSLRDIFPPDIVPGDYYIHLLHAQEGKIYYMPEVMSSYRRHSEGMWWLNATEEGKEEFSIKYGKKLLNFYDKVEENLDVQKARTYMFKRDIIKNAIISCSKNQKFEYLIEFRNNKDNAKIFDEIILEMIEKSNLYIEYETNRESIEEIKRLQHLKDYFYSLNYFQKFIYLLFIDSNRRKEIIEKKFKRTKNINK